MASGAFMGLLAGCALTLASLAVRLILGWTTPPELLLDLLGRDLPVPLADLYLGPASGATRPLAYGALLLAQTMVCTAVGALVGALRRRRGTPKTPETSAGLGRTRRAVVEGMSWAGVAAIGGTGLWRYLATRARAGAAGMGATPGSRGTHRGADGAAPEVTANADFYVVSKNLIDPRVNAGEWRLRVHGLVARELSLSYDELRAESHTEQWQTLLCISNETGGDYAGNALWRGVPLAELLRRAGLQPEARRIFFRAADEYADGVPLAAALRPETMVVTEMNGAPLPPEHGYPARLLVPGVYGLKNVKWLQSIEAVDAERRGFWQQRGWTDAATVKTTARIDIPRRGTAQAGATARVAGMAFAGDRGISAVEVSLDGGATWQAARLQAPKGPLSWTLWDLPWRPAPGQYRLVARAVDGRGEPQPARDTASLPDGAAGSHKVSVTVV